MYKLLFFLLLGTFLHASHPKIYAALGDTIYDNVHKIASLKNLEAYVEFRNEILEYENKVSEAKKKGFAVENSQKSELAKSYLLDLRELSKRNDSYLRMAKTNYEISLKNRNSKLFVGTVNSGIIDIAENKQKILEYYYEHLSNEPVGGFLATLVQEDRAAKRKRDAKGAILKTKKTYENEKIQRIRQNDFQAQKKLEEKLQEEIKKKKQEIRDNQKDELKL